MTLPLLRESLQPRIDGIQRNVRMLRSFADGGLEKFGREEVLERAHYHLRLALEGIFHISSHILSRTSGNRETEYKRMARKMGDLGIVPKPFADGPLSYMAGYRNRLTHFYADVQVEELYEICRNKVGDIEEFLKYVKIVLERPKDFGFTVE